MKPALVLLDRVAVLATAPSGGTGRQGDADASAGAAAEPELVREALSLAAAPHAGRAQALADRAEMRARELGDPALAGWAAEVRARAHQLDAAGLAGVLRSLRVRPAEPDPVGASAEAPPGQGLRADRARR